MLRVSVIMLKLAVKQWFKAESRINNQQIVITIWHDLLIININIVVYINLTSMQSAGKEHSYTYSKS